MLQEPVSLSADPQNPQKAGVKWRRENHYEYPARYHRSSVLQLPQAHIRFTTAKSSWEWWHTPLIHVSQRQADLCEFKTSLVYIVSRCKKEAREFALLERGAGLETVPPKQGLLRRK